jgi:hypothetical protein
MLFQNSSLLLKKKKKKKRFSTQVKHKMNKRISKAVLLQMHTTQASLQDEQCSAQLYLQTPGKQ